jgi:hypothetical protein
MSPSRPLRATSSADSGEAQPAPVPVSPPGDVEPKPGNPEPLQPPTDPEKRGTQHPPPAESEHPKQP